MPSISITEKDFETLSNAATEAFMNGEFQDAEELDKIARKINAALSSSTASKASGLLKKTASVSWKDMPSTLEHLKKVKSL